MSVFAPLGFIILSMLIMCFLMLVPGIFATFLHYASGQYSHRRVDNLSIFFIIGAETMVVLAFFLIAMIIWALPPSIINLNNNILLWILTGIFLALSLASFCFYFRKSAGSKLFLSHQTVNNFIEKTKTTKTRSDAFILGLVSSIPELPFTLPLYFISILSAMSINFTPSIYSGIIIIYAFIVILPLFIIHALFRNGHNLADFIKFRTRNKAFFRFLISFLYFIIAILFITFRIIP